MTTNRDWLFSLPLEEQLAWMNAEHAESPTSATMQHIGQVIESTVKRGVYGDTESENADSRERLEADMRELMRSLYEIGYTDAKLNYGILGEETRPRLFIFDEKRGAKFIELLDRQAAITAEETSNAWKEYRDATQREIAELTAEREKLKELNGYHAAQYELASEDCDRLQADADRLQVQVYELTAELEKATNNLNSANKDFENARAELTAERDELKGQVFTLKSECDDLESTCNVLENELYNAKAERERYRSKFGKCLDYADAIHALMDDEGMA